MSEIDTIDSKEARKRKLALQKKYEVRITLVKKGKEALSQKEYSKAAAKYQEYLQIFVELHDVENIYKLSPAHFNVKTELTEMLLISQIFWDLTRVNETTPQLQSAFNMCLAQFVKFTINQPYQVLNAEMLRKYIKINKKKSPQIDSFNTAYQQIFVQSKKCYISTLCFGQTDYRTIQLRHFKSSLARTNIGINMIAFYYRHSSRLVNYLEDHLFLKKIFTFISRPILTVFVQLLRYTKG